MGVEISPSYSHHHRLLSHGFWALSTSCVTLKSQKATQTFVVTGSSINIVYVNTINCHSEIQCILELKASRPPPSKVQLESGSLKSCLLLLCPSVLLLSQDYTRATGKSRAPQTMVRDLWHHTLSPAAHYGKKLVARSLMFRVRTGLVLLT